jgi:integrase
MPSDKQLPRAESASPPHVRRKGAYSNVAAPADANDYLKQFPLDQSLWTDVLKAIIRRHNWAHSVKDKGVSAKTMEERENFLFAFFRELRRNVDKPYRVDPRRLGNRHIRFMVNRWLERELAPGTIQQYMSILRTFSTWIGKPELVMDLARYIDDPARYKRTYCAVEDKSWSAHGVDAERMFDAMNEIDRYAAAQLAMKAAFGLRRKEALMLQPNRQVVTELQAGIENAPCEFYLDLLKGTKGGRRRYLSIDTERKRLALDRARAVARGLNDHLGDPARTLKENLRRVDYVMTKLGITLQALGITGHGLRHEYANDLYEKETGTTPPLRGGPEIDSALDRDARLKIAHELGHCRIQVSGAYIGDLQNARSTPAEPESDE